MASDLTQHINIGKDTATKLELVGIDSFEKLAQTGVEEAFIRLQSLDPGACLCLLYGLDGAISGIKSKELSKDRKKELQAFHRMTQKQLKK